MFLFLCLLLIQSTPKFYQFEGFEECSPCSDYTKMSNCGRLINTPGNNPFVLSFCNDMVPYSPAGTQHPFSGKAYGGFDALSNNNTSGPTT